MGRIGGRLRRLEERVVPTPTECEGGAKREVLRRMTNEELDAYGAALSCYEAGEDATIEDRALLARVEALYEEVRDESKQKS